MFVLFLRDERGAITVDWVVLTASLVGLSLAVLTVIGGGLKSSVDGVDDALNAPSLIVQMRTGFGYEAFNAAQFRATMRAAAALNDADLAQVAAYGNALAGELDDSTDPDVVGQVNDFNMAIDVAYAANGGTRPTGVDYDEDELTRISTEAGFATTVAQADPN